MVITASADGTDAYGFTDFAIGWFSIERNLLEGAHEIIIADWALRAADGQGREAYLFNEALASAALADQWAGVVWNDEEGDDIDDEDDEEKDG